MLHDDRMFARGVLVHVGESGYNRALGDGSYHRDAERGPTDSVEPEEPRVLDSERQLCGARVVWPGLT